MRLLLVQDAVPASQGSVERAALYVVGPMLYSIFASTENRGWWSLDVERSARRALCLERSQWPDCRSRAAMYLACEASAGWYLAAMAHRLAACQDVARQRGNTKVRFNDKRTYSTP